ncbi:LacI family DNA-binding transcriptional regulator [Coraliomargarita algicola]|uniref:LacI family DNA-binding transcriptional regulator n=1 Tax=Coraliomargarita algicola TaxID=3092156 RepID=A0ABZ0RHN6_9BACT|nr:LacI family DNA-binding transcriptional regulator [Coraliomargarita sp. J2-16]WPJ95567.1 LacI family DNA-binding transcriptional regulator [Coraliomargarita sp. J2-16]
MKRITCRELGRQLGLSHSAVSLALRDHPSIPEQTRKRVKNLAAKLGYRPDPALAALNAYRQSGKPSSYRATLAWIQMASCSDELEDPWLNTIFEGAQARAAEQGYHIERFKVSTGKDWIRLGQILKSRRIEGLMLSCISNAPTRQSFEWKDYFAVAVARQSKPASHLIANDQFQSAALAVRKLHQAGHRRIGIVMPREFAENTEYHFLGGFTSECTRQNIPPLYCVVDSPDQDSFQAHCTQWILEQELDAIIASGPGDLLPALKKAKLRVPKDISIAFLSRFRQHPNVASIDQNNRHIGKAAANQLIDLIRRNERGLPHSPIRILIEGIWVDGSSAPDKHT